MKLSVKWFQIPSSILPAHKQLAAVGNPKLQTMGDGNLLCTGFKTIGSLTLNRACSLGNLEVSSLQNHKSQPPV